MWTSREARPDCVCQKRSLEAGQCLIRDVDRSVPPQISVAQAANNAVEISWPAPTAAFAVQQTSTLDDSNWETLTNAPVPAGSRNKALIPWPNATGLFRLIWQ
jgi:hypothetical protein